MSDAERGGEESFCPDGSVWICSYQKRISILLTRVGSIHVWMEPDGSTEYSDSRDSPQSEELWNSRGWRRLA